MVLPSCRETPRHPPLAWTWSWILGKRPQCCTAYWRAWQWFDDCKAKVVFSAESGTATSVQLDAQAAAGKRQFAELLFDPSTVASEEVQPSAV